MEHFYQNIDGWFDFQDLYQVVVRDSAPKSHFVEVGAWYGKSSAFMAVEIANSGKSIVFDVIDHWLGSEEHKEGGFAADENIVKAGSIYDIFLNNLKPAAEFIHPVRLPSTDASTIYSDESLDFVFLDAAHDYENVTRDIEAWYPKVKRGAVIAGHDFSSSWPGLIQAVTTYPKFDQSKLMSMGLCWIYRKS